jgi:hypothetical protein
LALAWFWSEGLKWLPFLILIILRSQFELNRPVHDSTGLSGTGNLFPVAPQGVNWIAGGGKATFLLKSEAGGQNNVESENEKVAHSC